MTCPDCKTSGGLPYMASTQVGRPEIVRLGMRCKHCRSEWTCDLPTAERPPTDSD